MSHHPTPLPTLTPQAWRLPLLAPPFPPPACPRRTQEVSPQRKQRKLWSGGKGCENWRGEEMAGELGFLSRDPSPGSLTVPA